MRNVTVTSPSTQTPTTAGADCANRITSLEFTYKLANSSVNGFLISSVQMAYDTTTGTLTNNKVAELKVKTKFISDTGTPVEKSGNPGYLSGEKLLVKLQSGTTLGYSKEISDSTSGK